MTYDAFRERIVLFGGWVRQGGLVEVGDTWEYFTQSPAFYTTFGQSCPGTQTTPTLAARPGDRPWLGDTMGVELRDLPPGQPAIMLSGFSDTMWGNLRLPLPLDPIGMLGCFLYVSPDDTTPLANPNGVATWTARIPNDASQVGLRFFNQGAVFDPGANPLNIVSTNGGAGTLGAR